MKNFFKILIITFTVFVLSIGFWGVADAATNRFECKFQETGSISRCFADETTSDCDPGKVVVPSVCRFEQDSNFCNDAEGVCRNPSSITCSNNEDCPGEYICSSRDTCALSSSSFTCTIDDDCVKRYGDGYECVLHTCVDSSYTRCDREGSDCADGFVCNPNGRCVRDPNTDDGNNGDSGGGGIRLENPLSASTFEEFIAKLINSLIIFAGPILALIIVIGGFRFVLAGADPKQKEGGKNMIKYGVIGFIIMISAWVLVAILKGIF